jgi:Flp pilus assembly protein TadD
MSLRSILALSSLVWLGACAATTPETDLALRNEAPPVSRDVAPYAEAVREERYAAAVLGLRPVVQAHPDHTDAKLLLGEALLGQGDVGPAHRFFGEAQRQSTSPSQRVAALTGMGTVELYRGEIEAAERSFRRALDLDERAAEAWNGLAQSLDRQDRRGEAKTAARRAVRLAPQWQAARNNLGLILLHEGELAEAERHFAEAHALAPDVEVVANNLRLAIAMQGRYEEALAGIAPAAEPDAFNNVGYAAIVRGDLATADRYLRRAVEASPSFHEQAHDNLRFLSTLRQNGGGTS